jgi:hypothetical protein
MYEAITEENVMPVPTMEISEEKQAIEPKKTRKPRATTKASDSVKKNRDVEELVNIAPKNMTEKEKEKLINHYNSEMQLKDGKILALQNNCEQAYAKLRRVEEDYASMERFYRERLAFVDQQLTAFNNAVKLSIGGGLN